MDKIFKYRDLTSDGTIKILKNNTIYFNEPKNFNDPFDSFIELNLDGDLDEWGKYFKEIGLPEDLARINLDNIQTGITNPSDFYHSASVQNSSMLKISCFSEETDNMLLWSHYAKDHTGICIGFKVYSEYNSKCLQFDSNDLNMFHTMIPKGVIPLIKVIYSNSMPAPYNRLKDPSTRLMEFAKTKSKCWEYEKEYRAIVFNSIIVNNPIRFGPHEITDIIFGINTKPEDRTQITDIINSYPSNGNWIKIHECSREQGQYKIKITQMR